MTRITTTVVIILVLLNGSATMMEVSGFNDDIGVTIDTGVGDELQDVIQTAKDGFQGQAGIVESFVGLAIGVASLFTTLVFDTIFMAPTMMINILGGGPTVTAAVGAFMSPMYIVATLEVMAILLGNRTV